MSDRQSCVDCGAPLPLDGLCTRCLIRLGLASAGDEGRPDIDAPAEDPHTIGPYHVVRKLGEGGMGVVYLAEQAEPIRRTVAIKVIKLGMGSRDVVGRFEAERQALAEMDHPGIARVFEAGSTPDGRPYFVMEHVDGKPITKYCDGKRLTTRQRVGLFADVCDAVHHAHLRGVIHRDLKPSNVLVTEIDGDPQVKVIDFGVAKATERSLVERSVLTELGQIVGTLEYMSPEQAAMTGLDVDLRSDVYSLGVLFFELLVGSLPFEGKDLRRAGLEAMLRAIREEDSPRPSTRISTLGGAAAEAARNRATDPPSLARHLRGDLDWVVMCAMEKDRARRYASASELAADVRRYIDHEPVLAGPPGRIYRVRKFLRRHSMAVTTAAVLLAGAATLIAFYTIRLRAQRDRAEREAAKALQVVEFVKGLFSAADPRETAGVELTVRELLERGAEQSRTELRGQPEVQAEITGLLGSVYTELGDHDRARELLEGSVSQREELYGHDHPEVARALRELARLDYKDGRMDDAERRWRRTLEIQASSPGVPAREIAITRKDLCFLFQTTGDLDAAIEQGRRALELLRSASVEPDSVLVEVYAATGYALLRRNELEQARGFLERGLTLAREVLGPKHPDLAYHLDYNAHLRRRAGNVEGALAATREALEIRLAALGERHPQTAESMHNVAVQLSLLGRYEESETLFRRALSLREKILGERHWLVSITAYTLAGVYEQTLRLEQAEGLFRKAADIQLETTGRDDFRYARTLARLGTLRLKRDDPVGAEPLLREALELSRHALPEGHRELARPLLWLAWVLTATNRAADAEPLLREALEIRRADTPDSVRVAEVEAALAACLARLGRMDEARASLDASAARLRGELGPEQWLIRQLEATEALLQR